MKIIKKSTEQVIEALSIVGKLFAKVLFTKRKETLFRDDDLYVAESIVNPSESWIAVAAVNNYRIICRETSLLITLNRKREAVIIENAVHLLRKSLEKDELLKANALQYMNAILIDYQNQVDQGHIIIDDTEGHYAAISSVNKLLNEFRDVFYRITCDELLE